MLTDEEIIKLDRDFEIGAHTMTHPRLTTINEKQAFNEIIESKKYLENLIKKKVNCFCYPGGKYNNKIKELVEEAGFIGGRTIKRYCFKCPSDPLVYETTIQTYNNISDILKILRFSKFNPLQFYENLNWEHRAKRMFDYVLKHGGVYHLWGHSWEIEKNHYWYKLEDLLAYIRNRQNLKYLTNSEVITNSTNKEKNNKLKLMIVTPYFYPKVGGLENYAYHIAKGLEDKHDWEIVVITSNHEEKKDRIEKLNNIKIYRLSKWFNISNTPINPMWYFQIKNIIKKEKPDVINAHTPVPFISDVTAMVCGNIPFILTYHTGSMMLKGKLLKDLLIKFYESSILKITLKKTKKIICSSDFVRVDFLKDYSKNTITITPGVDINRFKPGIADSKNKILFVAGLKKAEKYKGLEYLLSAVNIIKKNIKDAKLTVVGEGDYVTYYKKLCKNLGIIRNVEFKGVLYNKNLVKEYQKTNVFVLPSLYDSCPLVLLEAMACKKPVVGSDIGGIPYLIDNGKNGLLVPPKDPEALAKAIIKILKNPKLAKKMGRNGYMNVMDNFTWSKKIKKTNDLFADII